VPTAQFQSTSLVKNRENTGIPEFIIASKRRVPEGAHHPASAEIIFIGIVFFGNQEISADGRERSW